MKTTTLGSLRHRLILEAPDLTPDTGGGTSIIWVKVADVWAAINPLSMREQFAVHQTISTLTHRITIRYRSGVLPEMRLTKDNRIFEILAVINEKERNNWLYLDCAEKSL